MSDTDTLEREEKKEKHCGCSEEPEINISFSLDDNKDDSGLRIKFGDKIIEGKETELPLKATKIKAFKTLSVLQAEGSHYLIIRIGGISYKFNLPH